jgi:nitrogen fixation protein NifU and related proteins
MTHPLEALYRDIILDHYRSPRGVEPIESADVCTRGSNPSCGDELQVQLRIEDDKISKASITARGCAISIASSSMLTEVIEGMTLDEAVNFGENIRKMMHGKAIPEDFDLGDIDALKGVRKFPVRVKCAMLAWVATLEAIRKYRDGEESDAKIEITTET